MIAERHIYGEAMYGFPMITTGCERDETKDYKYCWNLFSGDRDHVTALSEDHIISETKTVRSDGERIDAEEKQKKTG